MELEGLSFTYNSVKEYIENQGYFLLENEYINCDTKLKIKCDKGHIFSMSFYNFKNLNCRCPECEKINKRKPYNEIKQELNEHNYELLTSEKDYKGSTNKIKVKCKNKHIQNISYHNLKSKNFNCSECRTDEQYNTIVNLLNDKNYIIITKRENFKNYQTYIEYFCNKGHYHKTKAKNLFKIKGCQECANKKLAKERKLSYKDVKQYIENLGYKLLSTEYNNYRENLYIQCHCGCKYYSNFGNFKEKLYRGCPDCFNKSQCGENHPNWQGGITDIYSILRYETMKEWKIESLKQTDFRCCLTNIETHGLEIHHINKNFKDIVLECLNELELQDKNLRQDITEIKLERLKQLNEEKHILYGLGIPLNTKLHNLFHGQYSNKNNTIQQFKEFISRLENGEFSDFLKENDVKLNINYKILNELLGGDFNE